MNYKSTIKSAALFFLVFLVALNAYFVYRHTDPFTRNKIWLSSFSEGQSYYGRLMLWQQFAQKGDWKQALELEKQLQPSDINQYKELNQPQYLETKYNQLLTQGIKNQEDWLELAKIQIKLGKLQDAKISISQAYYLDPVRDDIYQLYLQFNK